ncbi:MAG: Flagellar hook-associated protein FlgL [Candidatus Ozemobacter sibiricus]|uniref:Flagellar hook-associated protein FlgL n=1 Tax=Candidatus Ozemobacter sibiricus TaxID=2268124 RepID=A0A367ZR29_9BACT|nr:MAG: Flagellar hook-associated protein FlgL [Candidatus Ozemobacter sibiricus]
MMRVSNQWVVNSFLRVLNRNHAELNKTQIQVSSGKQIQRPSENPINNALTMQHRTELLEGSQYARNIARTKEWLDNTDAVLTDLEATLQRVRELAVQGANDTLVQADRDAIAKEVEQLLLHVVDIANTDIGGEYLFAGHDVKTKPIKTLNGLTPGSMANVVTFPDGTTRPALNLQHVLDVIYAGDNKKMATEIEKGVLLTKNITGAELFFRGQPIVPQPSFSTAMPPLNGNLPLAMLNGGKGVQPGIIIITDANGIDHRIDLTYAHRLDDVLHQIGRTGSFEAGIEEVPSNTAVDLGIYRSAGRTNVLVGLSDPAMDGVNVPLSRLNGGRGVDLGFLSINTRDGLNRRIDLTDAVTVQDVINRINAVDGGTALEAKYDMIHRRLEITDKTGGTGEFTVSSKKNQLYIKDLPAHTAADLGLLKDAWPGTTIISTFDPVIQAETTPLSALNGGKGVEKGFLSITGSDGVSVIVDLRNAITIKDVIDAINNDTGGRQTATFDTATKRMVITDNTTPVPGVHFQIREVNGRLDTAADLGLWQDAGSTNIINGFSDPQMTGLGTPLSALKGGQGVHLGVINITGRDGINSRLDLSAAVTVQDVIDAINLGTGGRQTASFDAPNNRIVVIDNTTPVAGKSFAISGLPDGEPIAVRDITTMARRLGLLGSTQGSTLIGESLQPPGLTTASLLADLNPPPEPALITIRGADGQPVPVDLTGARTIQDVLDRINALEKFQATFDEVNNRFVVRSAAGAPGLQIEEQTNTARDLGFIVGASRFAKGTITGAPIFLKALPTLIGGIDLNPAVEGDTELAALNCSRTANQGVNLGTIRITDKAGHFKAIDLRGCVTIDDVLQRLNDPGNGLYIEARINAARNGLEIIDKNHGATGRLEIIDVDSTTAADLGIAGWTLDTRLIGRDVDPGLRDSTRISALRVNEGGVPLGKVFVQSGEFSGEIDLTGVKTIGELLDRFSRSDYRFNLAAWINPDGKRLNLTNTKDQPFIKVRELEPGEPAPASALGLGGSRSIFSTLADLRDNLLRNDAKAISEQSIKFIQEDIERVLKFHAEVGVKTNRATAAQEKRDNINLHLNKLLDVVENVDMTEAITRMTMLETAFRAALQSGAQIMQTTLMEFLK